LRHDPPRIVYAGRVWRGTMEVPMPILPKLPDDITAIVYVGPEGCPTVGLFVDGAEVGRHRFSQTVEELRAERAAPVTPPAAGLFDDEGGEG
jgi:hypothetical protein